MGEKRVVPGPLKTILNVDAAVTTVFCRIVENYMSPTKFRTHFKALEVCCLDYCINSSNKVQCYLLVVFFLRQHIMAMKTPFTHLHFFYSEPTKSI